MPRPPQIDRVELGKMLDKGRSQREIAVYFGVNESSVSKAKYKLKKGIVKSTTRTQLRRFIDKKMDALEQMQTINTAAHALLDLYLGWINGDKESLDKLKAQIEESKLNKREEAKKEAVLFLKIKDPHELAIKIMAEIRGQIALQLDITKTLYDMKAMQEFQEEVLGAIGEVAPDVRARIIERLNKRRALHGAVRFK